MKTPYSLLLLTLGVALVCAPALAEKADRDKPMNIEADALRHDEQKRFSRFTGKVVVTKGTLLMRGNQLDVRQESDGSQTAILTPEAGQRVFYRQKREGLDEYTEGEAELIEYDGRADRVKLTHRAELRRYRSASLSDQINGSVIVFDNNTEVFTVDGKPSGAAGEPGSGGRVRAMLGPRNPAGAASPAKPPASPATPPLRSSTSLGGERQ